MTELTGAATFEVEYGRWVEEQNRQVRDLRAVLQAHASDVELRILVESGMSHYDELFRMKAAATEADVFFIISGMWKTSAERVFLWIGGFRPSAVLKVRQRSGCTQLHSWYAIMRWATKAESFPKDFQHCTMIF